MLASEVRGGCPPQSLLGCNAGPGVFRGYKKSTATHHVDPRQALMAGRLNLAGFMSLPSSLVLYTDEAISP